MRKRQRRAQHKRQLPNPARDPKTGSVHLPHRVDPATGMYRGRQVVIVSVDE
jgi:large subunit ribosomal protein L32